MLQNNLPEKTCFQIYDNNLTFYSQSESLDWRKEGNV
jgi:hypothetical protein